MTENLINNTFDVIFSLAGCCRPGSVQSLRPGVQMSAQDGSKMPVCLLPTGLRRHLRLAYRGRLNFPRVKLASYGGRSFAYAGPSNWNSLPAYLRDSSLSLTSFRRHLGAFLFSFCWASTRSAFGVLLQKARYINSLLLFIAAIMSQPCTSNRISS